MRERDLSAHWQILLLLGTCLHAGRSYCSKVLVCLPTELGSPKGEWGDEHLMVLLELLPMLLSHPMPNLSWQQCTLTRYDIWRLAAHAGLAPAG